eukprot:9487991-Pyramimonas_sp.AAC.1
MYRHLPPPLPRADPKFEQPIAKMQSNQPPTLAIASFELAEELPSGVRDKAAPEREINNSKRHDWPCAQGVSTSIEGLGTSPEQGIAAPSNSGGLQG